MPWFRVDDSFHSHPKTMAAGTHAVGLWMRCGSYCAQHLTDGFVPVDVVKAYGTNALARRLVDVGFWDVVQGGYQFHDWSDYQPSREQVQAERRHAAERQRRARDAAKGRRDSTRDSASVTHLSRRDTAVTHEPVTPVSQSPRSRTSRREVRGSVTVTSDSSSDLDADTPRDTAPDDSRTPEPASGTQPPDDELAALADAVCAHRRTWARKSVEGQIRKAHAKSGSWPRTAAATLAVALDTNVRLPSVLLLDGRHWKATGAPLDELLADFRTATGQTHQETA
ncbi:MAG: hypothetical protein JWR88_1037 [Pseudonocardia sp.]|nr:hypothetical protein [Pseudonocardia sp.]